MTPDVISHYKIIKKIGEGGIGQVYLAEDTILQRQIAIKILAPHSIQEKDLQQRFLREARAAATLNHPNIVTIYEMGKYGDQDYIAMEYIFGNSVRELINQKQLDVKKSIDIILQVCDGIYKAHQSGIIHRDIKPENILVNHDGGVKVLDFGIAKLKNTQTLTRSTAVVGTLFYMSPELVQNKTIDTRSDIFSTGCVLYEMLTGMPCFQGEHPYSIMYSIVHEEPKPLKEFDDTLPEELQVLLNRALQKQPEKRHQTMAQFKMELNRVAADLFKEQEESPANISKPTLEQDTKPRTIEQLLEERQKIDQIIASEYTKNVTIMFSDVVGSTAFFERRGNLEGRAMIQRYFNLMSPIIQKYNGQIIKTIGDGILASFHKAIDGANAAIEMQRSLHEDNNSRLEEDRIATRIALHFGKAVIDAGDVFGDVVNVASRLEQFAQPDDILVSSTFFNQLKDDKSFQFKFAGETLFKGKSQQMPYYQLQWNMVETPEGGFAESPKDTSSQVREKPAPSKKGVQILKPYTLAVQETEPEISVSGEVKNPYMNRVKIQNIHDFYGRKSEVMKIYSRIGASRPQSISIVGERRIGKSSLLNYLYHPKNRRSYLSNPDEFLFVFVDFQERRDIHVEDFFQIIYKNLEEEFGGNLILNEKPDYGGFKNVVNTLDRENLKLILIFDEFEVITKNKNFDSEFYAYARSIANNFNVAYVVSSGRNLQTLCHSREISDSPFFNIFSNLTLTQFSQQEAEELVTQPAKRLNVSMKPFVPLIFDIAGFYPFFIQMACAPIFEYAKNESSLSKDKIELIKDEFFDEAKVHFQQIWDICDEDKREILLLLAAGHSISESKDYVLKQLIKEGYVKIQNKQPEVFSSLFGDFILRSYGPDRGIQKKKRFLFW